MPTAALRGEGTSRYFVEKAYPAVADFTLLRAIATTLEEVYADSESAIHIGAIYTTDSFAAETEEFLRHWQSRNLLGIEMETSVIYNIPGLYGMKATAIHIVSDKPVAKKNFPHPIPEEDQKPETRLQGPVDRGPGQAYHTYLRPRKMRGVLTVSREAS